MDTQAVRLYTASGNTHKALSQSDELNTKVETATEIQQQQFLSEQKNDFENFDVAFSGWGKDIIDLDNQVQVLEEAGIPLPETKLKKVSVPEIEGVDITSNINQ